jgi:hypothetical protein
MGPLGPGSRQYGSRYSMSTTCGPRDIISLVIPRIGDLTSTFSKVKSENNLSNGLLILAIHLFERMRVDLSP